MSWDGYLAKVLSMTKTDSNDGSKDDNALWGSLDF